MSSKIKDTTLDFGFVQIPVSVFGATQDDTLSLKTLCCGATPKQTIRCQGECGTEYTSWVKAPQRGYEWSKGKFVVLTPEEIAQVNETKEKVDSMKVVKAVPFQKVEEAYVFDGAYRVLPPERATGTTLQAYRTVYEIVRESDRAILVRFSPRDKVRHYALVADEDGTLWARQLSDRTTKPYDVPASSPDAKAKAQGKALIESVASDDATFEPEPDPLFELVEKKVAEMAGIPGIGQTVIVPE